MRRTDTNAASDLAPLDGPRSLAGFGCRRNGERCGAMLGQGATLTIRLAGGAYFSTVPDHGMSEVSPQLAGHYLHEVAFDFDGVLGIFAGPGQCQSRGQAADVRIDHHPLILTEGGAQHDVGRLPRHAGQCHQVVHGIRHFPLVIVHNLPTRPLNALGFLPKETRGMNDFFDFQTRRFGERLGRLEPFEQNRRHFVDGHIGGLGG